MNFPVTVGGKGERGRSVGFRWGDAWGTEVQVWSICSYIVLHVSPWHDQKDMGLTTTPSTPTPTCLPVLLRSSAVRSCYGV